MVDVQEAVVGDSDAVGVAGQIGQNVGGTIEGWLGVDDPVDAASLLEEASERSRAAKMGKGSVELESVRFSV